MKISKDQARILAAAISSYKYELVAEKKDPRLMPKLDLFEESLEGFGKDKRRTGRTSMDDFSDCIKRFAAS